MAVPPEIEEVKTEEFRGYLALDPVLFFTIRLCVLQFCLEKTFNSGPDFMAIPKRFSCPATMNRQVREEEDNMSL